MYGGTPGQGGGGALPVVGGAILLPNTGGNTVLTIIAIVAIAVGTAVLLSSAARLIAKKVSTKA